MSQKEVAIVGHNNTRAQVTGQEELLVRVNSIGSTTGLATENTLLEVKTNTTGVVRTPNLLRVAGSSGTIAAGKFSMSFASVGTANATVGGMILKPGETINFDAGALNNTLSALAYDATAVGAELIIIAIA